MSKLFDLLSTVIGKLNKTVSTDKQQLTDEQKAQAKANLGISDIDSGGGDWNQNDPNCNDYVQNRTHWKEDDTIELLSPTIFTPDNTVLQTDWDARTLSSDDTVSFIIDGVEYVTHVDVTDSSYAYYVNAEVYTDGSLFRISDGMDGKLNVDVVDSGYFTSHEQCQVQILRTRTTYHILSDKYIPDNIARRSEVQGDWNVNDYADTRYIRNKPFYHIPATSVDVYRDHVVTRNYQQINCKLDADCHYSVLWLDETHTFISKWVPHLSSVYIGNLSLGYSDRDYEDSGEDFLIVYDCMENSGTSELYLSQSWLDFYDGGEVRIAIDHNFPEELVKLDEKFIPDTVARVSDMPITEDELDQLDALLA